MQIQSTLNFFQTVISNVKSKKAVVKKMALKIEQFLSKHRKFNLSWQEKYFPIFSKNIKVTTANMF